jgi:hypothetical protein
MTIGIEKLGLRGARSNFQRLRLLINLEHFAGEPGAAPTPVAHGTISTFRRRRNVEEKLKTAT